MKKLFLIIPFLFGTAAFGSEYEQSPMGDTNNTAVGFGLGIGVGLGKAKAHADADASARSQSKAYSEGGNAKSYSKGGDAKSISKGGHAKQGQGQGQGQKQKQDQAQDQANAQNTANEINIIEEHDYQEIPVATAWAPPTEITAPCVIGASAGGQVADYGISFGGGFVDDECVLNRDIALFKSMGATPELLHQVMCQKNSYRTASANIPGLECPEYEGEAQTALRPIRDKTFGATTVLELASKRKCHIADEGCF